MNDPRRFDPASVDTFGVVDRFFDPESRTVTLTYRLGDDHRFTETVTFETEPRSGARIDRAGVERAMAHLHIAAGTSYYKAAAPPVVVVEHTGLSPEERAFHHHLYDDGLREFAVANGLPVPRVVELRAEGPDLSPPPAAPSSRSGVSQRSGGLVVPIGGGKDSMVLIESVKHLQPRLFAVNPHPLVVELATRAGLELLVVRRRLSPQLGELNRAGALNGHVPITAIVSLIAVVGSFVYGYDTIAMAVERSASEETVMVNGVPVNHQYSKSIEFEDSIRALIAGSIDPTLTYGSALRPYSELAIARAFARMDRYHGTFCSCNTVYRQDAGSDDRWCGACPKCRFVGLMLAPFLPPGAVAAIIGRDLFDDPDQVPGFAALMSDADKPFECVGERRESAAAFRILARQPLWRDKPVVAALSGPARAMVSEVDVQDLLTARPDHSFPDDEIAAAVARTLVEVP